ncbi:hypothetical protein ACEPAH_3132 [Sanghuangporus vaninii]
MVSETDKPYVAAYHDKKTEDEHTKLKSARRLILCFDGTGNHYSSEFLKCLQNDDVRQLVYYQTGIGTYTNPAFVTGPVISASMVLDAAIGWNLEQHVQDGYRFLMQRYRSGDKVSLFGFSRGAYTARALCGFIQKVGLLPPENHAQIPFAWNVFKKSDEKGGLEHCMEYKKSFSIDVKIDFMGLWDTVASIGFSGRELPFAKPKRGDPGKEDGIRVYRHALALDERRAYFTPNFKLTVDGPDEQTDKDVKFSDIKKYKEAGDEVRRKQIETREHVKYSDVDDDLEDERAVLRKQVREVWFSGCHCDVGGGSVPNSRRHSLSRISLRWMIRECFRMNTGITFNKQMLADIGFGGIPFQAKVDSPKWPKRSSSNNDPQGLSQSFRERLARLFIILRALLALLFYIFRAPLALLFLPIVVLWHLWKLIKYSKCFRGDVEEQTQSSQGILGVRKEVHGYGSDVEKNAGKLEEVVDENEEDWKDAAEPIHDELSRFWRWFWWVFECLPLLFRVQNSVGGKRDDFETRINGGRGRIIYGDAWNVCVDEGNTDKKLQYIEVHHSVSMRMATLDYKPHAHFKNFDWDKEGLDKVMWVR